MARKGDRDLIAHPSERNLEGAEAVIVEDIGGFDFGCIVEADGQGHAEAHPRGGARFAEGDQRCDVVSVRPFEEIAFHTIRRRDAAGFENPMSSAQKVEDRIVKAVGPREVIRSAGRHLIPAVSDRQPGRAFQGRDVKLACVPAVAQRRLILWLAGAQGDAAPVADRRVPGRFLSHSQGHASFDKGEVAVPRDVDALVAVVLPHVLPLLVGDLRDIPDETG